MKFKTLRFTLVSLLMFVCGTVFAGSITFGNLELVNGVQYSDPFDGGDFTVTFAGGGNDGKYYTTGTGIRVYAGGTMTVAAKSGNITSITVTYAGDSYKPSDGDVVDVGTYNAETGEWTGEAASVVFTRPSGSGHWRVQAVTVTTSGAAVATPTFTPNGGTFVGTTSVEIACETEGATIYYSMNGADPVAGSSPQYGRALPITETTTVKAIAVKGNDQSAVASATFTQIPSYTSFTAMNSLANNDLFAYTGKAFIVAKPTDKYVYLYNPDEQDFALIYDNSGAKTTAAEVGKYITPGWTGKVNIYRNLFELVPDNDIVVNDDPAQPVSYPAIALGNAVMNQVFTLKDVTNFAVDGKNITIKANGDDKDISEAQGVYGYNQFNIEIPTFEEGKTYQMVGAIGQYNDKVQFWPIEITEQVEETPDAFVEAKTALQTAIAIASNINPEGLADAITAAQAALTAEGATAESLAQATLTLEAAIKAYFNQVLPNLGAIVTALNDSTLNAAYADAQAALAKENVTPQELTAAMQQIIVAAQAVAPAHLQNLKGYAVKYGATEATSLIDAALAAIEAGNVAQIITTMTAVKEAATPLAQQVLSGITAYVQAFGLTEQAAQAQAAMESGNYITMITTAKALFTHLVAAANEYLPKLGDIAEGLNDETLNGAYAEAEELLAKESITPEELGAAMQNIIVAAKAVAPEHLQNLKGYAVKYGAEEAAALVDSALVAIEAGNVSQIIATMTAVKEAATPLAQQVLSGITAYVQAFGLTEQAAQAQAAMESGNYITMITTAKALFTHLVAAANEYLPKLGDIAEGLNDETLNGAYAEAEELLAKESITPEELGAAMQNIITAAQAVAPEHLQNLKGYAVKYGAGDAATLIDDALAAIEAGNVSQIIATMTAVKTAATPLAQQVLSTMISYVQQFGLTEQAAQAQAALDGGNYITMITTAKALFTHLVAAANEYLPKLGDIAEGLNDETLNTAYAAAQALLAKESITPEELAAAMQNIITAAQAVAPEHLQNLKGYAVKYGAGDAATLIDDALAAIEAGNVSQIIATMTAVKTAATPLAQQILSTMISYVQQFGLTEQAAQAQAALESDNYITMITTAKALFTHLVAAAQEYLPKLGDIAEGLNDETLNTAYAAAQALLAQESITPEELATAMQNIITAAQAVAPAHLQNLKGYAVKYGAGDAATLIDDALAAIEAGNVAQIIAAMTAVKTAATPLAETVLSTMIGYVQQFGLTDQAAQAQAALDGGNYITMITTAKALFTHLVAAANEYLPKLGDIAEGLNDETLNGAYAEAEELLAKESITPEELGAAMQNIIVAAKAVAPEHLQNLKGYAVKYGAEEAAALVDSALVAIEAGNVSQIIATMTAVKAAATPLATNILTQMIADAQNYQELAEDVTAAQAALEGGNYITMIITAKDLYAKLIAVGAPAEVTLTDGNDLTALQSYVGQTVNLTYTRSFTEGKTATVCLPFAYTKKEDDGSFYAFTNIEKEGSEYVATMTEPNSTTLEANTPYLYLPNATGDVDFGGAYTIPGELTAGETTSNGWTFKGTFETIEWETAPTGIYGFAAQDQDGIYQGQFVKVGDYVRIKPMRCYLVNESFAGVRGVNRAAEQLPDTIKVRLVDADGNETGIGTISTKTGEVTIDNDAWYTLDGRRVVNPTKGVYVKNGKKVSIK